MDNLPPNDEPCSILIKGRGLSWTSLRTPPDQSRNKPCEQAMRDRTSNKVNIKRTRVWAWGYHGTNGIRWHFELAWHKILYISFRRWKLCNQTKLFHQVQNVILCSALQKKLRKHMMKQFHAEDTTFFNFLPEFGNLGFLSNKMQRD